MAMSPAVPMGDCTMTILERVAAAEGLPILDLPPLYYTIDPECLERLVEHGQDVRIAFEYCGHRVHIENGCVTLAKANDAQMPGHD